MTDTPVTPRFATAEELATLTEAVSDQFVQQREELEDVKDDIHDMLGGIVGDRLEEESLRDMIAEVVDDRLEKLGLSPKKQPIASDGIGPPTTVFMTEADLGQRALAMERRTQRRADLADQDSNDEGDRQKSRRGKDVRDANHSQVEEHRREKVDDQKAKEKIKGFIEEDQDSREKD